MCLGLGSAGSHVHNLRRCIKAILESKFENEDGCGLEAAQKSISCSMARHGPDVSLLWFIVIHLALSSLGLHFGAHLVKKPQYTLSTLL